MRRLGILLLALLIASVWLRTDPPSPSNCEQLDVARLPLPDAEVARAQLGAFRLDGVWRLTSPHEGFGGYSALAALPDGRLFAASDRGYWLRFAPPDSRGAAPRFGPVLSGGSEHKISRDVEAAALDPASGTIWLAWEGRNAISRHAPGANGPAWVRPAAMRGWRSNGGPETLVRLRDGRFLVLEEGRSAQGHAALLFPDDPVMGGKPLRARLRAPEGFSPTDAAQLPDGRVLIVMRRLVWPMPFRFVGRIAIADPAEFRAGQDWHAREVARLGSRLPVDNFEGLAVVPGPGGRVTVWMISDDNMAVSQRTLLWKLTVDPKTLR